MFDDGLARKDLENIVHPAVGAEFQQRIADILADDPNAIVVYDIPLLIETKRVDEFDAVIVVACDPQVRHDRLITLRGLSNDEAWSRISAQATEDERGAVADWVIESGESIESTLAQTDRVWSQILDAYRV